MDRVTTKTMLVAVFTKSWEPEVRDLVLSLFCVIATSETASLGEFCNGTITCDYTGGLCNASKCGCNAGYGEYNGECKSSFIAVSLTGPVNSVMYGSSTSLTANITTSVDVTAVVWQKVVSGGSLSNITLDSTKYTQTGDLGSGTIVLTINNLDYSDKAIYQVQVTNNLGRTDSSNQVVVDVAGGPPSANVSGPTFGSPPSDVEVTGTTSVVHNSTATFNGSYTSVLPSVTITWQKQGTNNNYEDINISSSDGKYSGSTDTGLSPKLVINYVKFTDKTSYRMVVNNSVGFTNSEPAALDVTGGVLTVTTGPKVAGRYRGSVTITCTVEGPEVNKILWKKYRDNTHLQNITINGSKYTGGTVSIPSLTINSLTDDDMGQYQCTASNPGGTYLSNNKATVNILDPLPPSSILYSESSFAHNNLTLKWTPPSNTFVTRYEVMIDSTIQFTADSNPRIHITMKSLTPGKYYVVSIVTISGTSGESTGEKRSTAYTETIRITPTKPGSPINLSCPQHPKDISLEISWEPPINPNGQIVMYQVHVNPGNPGERIINTTNNVTNYNVMGLIPEKNNNFTVRTINDAEETEKVSEPSETINCSTKAGVSGPPTYLSVNEIGSRGFKIRFDTPENVKDQLAGYRIVIMEGSACVQEIFLVGNCPQCKDIVDCTNPQFIQKPDIYQPMVHQVTELKPYTHYIVKVAAVNRNGEGRFNNATAKTGEETPQKPGSIRATHMEAKTLTLSWDVAGPSPGNTTYTIEVYEGTDDTGANFILKQPKRYTYGFHQKSLSIADLEEYWSYKFKVIAATIKGINGSDLSDIVRTKQAAPGQVANLTVNIKEGNYRVAYAYWNIPSLRERNGVLENYHFKITNKRTEILTGTIPVSFSIQRVEQNFTVEPEKKYTVTVFVTNNESMAGQDAQLTYTIPSGRPPIDNNIELISTMPGLHKSSQQTITVELNTDFFRNDLNGILVLFGITVCEKSKCKNHGSLSVKENWERLPNWHDASKTGFPL
ncbi:receptor-type tyrosine-protein phosphatase eta-like [Saccostrea cucullata]|uniref:receptor-type tyrosine-protein phosphatase eta-like n=1 Tax=Saccostrea cuccullata TaxID=36930 RepID=UPI002ED49591